MRPASSHPGRDLARVALRWRDEPQTFLARSLPFRIEIGPRQVVVAPGEPVEVARGPVVVRPPSRPVVRCGSN